MLVSRGGRRRFLWTQQVDAADGVSEDEKTRGGNDNGARAEEQWREEEDEWLKARRAGGGDSNGARAEEQWREEEDEWLKARRAGLFIRARS